MNTKQFSHWLLLFLLLAVLGMVVGCTSQEVSVTEADNGKTIELSQGQVLLLTLDSNITTGYEWDIENNNDQILSLESKEYVAPDTELVGAGGQEVYRFECVGTGQGTLTLIYHQPFDTAEPAETFTLQITGK